MENERTGKTLTLFKRILLAMVAPAWAVEVDPEEAFPTRTIEMESFSFDPVSGSIQWRQSKRTEPFRFTVDGLVETPVELRYADLRSLPSVTQVSDFHCVEGWTVPRVTWSGFKFQELLKLVRPLQGSDFVLFHSLGETESAPAGQKSYIECFSVADLLDAEQEILLVLDLDGKPLTYDRGAPLRIIAPYRQAYKSAKFVYRAEFTDRMHPGWWTLANPIYDADARVPPHRLEGR